MSAPRPTFSHEALFYDDLPGFLAGTVPFLEAGIAGGEPALVAVEPVKVEALRAALPDANGHVQYVDMTELGRNPGRIISAWAEFMQEHAGAPTLRGIGEPVWPGRTPDELVECQRHEALLNLAFAEHQGFVLRCPYDRGRLDDSVLSAALHSHPVLTIDGRTVPSGRFEAMVAPYAGTLPEPACPVDQLDLAVELLPEVRRRVTSGALAAEIDADRAADLALAVTEAVTNTLRHAGGRGILRTWQDGRSFVCEVRDGGRIDDPLAGRLPVPVEQPTGRGLWLMHQLCDLVQVRSSAAGTTVRLHLHA